MQLKRATRSQVKLRLGLSAVSGGGKTFSALRLAHGMTNDWTKIAVIDTENKSASLYSHMGEFNVIDLEPPYSPERYIQAIKTCEDAGMEVIIIDSVTHEWDGKGGILNIADSMTGNSFTNWAKLTPRHQAFIDAILQSKCHVITCVRRKQDYEMTKDSNGKTYVQKSGLKEITREGFEYELTLNFTIELNHMATASKDRTGLYMGKPEFVITEDTGRELLAWCNSGEVPLPEAFMTESEAIAAISECKSKDELTALYRALSQSVRTLESVIAASKLKASEWN
jgi:hypothetical protein